jgi:hypothetical protein
MFRKVLSTTTALLMLVGVCAPLGAYSIEYSDSGGVHAQRWVSNPIIIALSTSLNAPPANIKPGSDLIGAVRRALQHWSNAADIKFFETSSTVQTISPANLGDRVNLITVSTDNAATFGKSENPGLTRVFYDSGGAIVEGDVALNPNERFSSDGTPGTYDLESTLTHEIGHLLGLEHSAILGATMQPRQPKNGLYGLPAFTQRTLSEDDDTGIRSLYGPRSGSGSISGKLLSNVFARAQTVFGGHVFVEDAASGRVVASSVTLANGDYHLNGLAPGAYRLIGESLNGPVAAGDIASGGSYAGLTETTPSFRSFVGVGSSNRQFISVGRNAAVESNYFVFPHPVSSLRPQVIGMNGELSTAALPLEPGKTYTIYVGGDGVDQLSADNISMSSRLIAVKLESLSLEEFNTPYPVISFEITLAPNIQPGDYSIRLQSENGEFAYLAGAVTIEPTLQNPER